ncbi:ComEC/Rec2 family competence protein [Aurantibacter crassamenti]|uniref:ComEC/Rec2 family competence protein n=1 Tax=Aurantibacter crassamenti TaxID=1837375 RepID=UPI00193A6834|nr:ComEC/Rec2 family competence protein [Aurantibacter crassamenti]MBM1104688.1 ComEC/Rec2 family competence protein [Aurantibacter crassamenti]
MRLLRFIPIKLTVFLILGIVLNSFIQLTLIQAIVLTVVLTTILAIIFIKVKDRKNLAFGSVTFLLTISIGILSSVFSNPASLSSHYSKLKKDKAESWHIKISEVLKPTNFSNRYFATLISLDGKKVTGKILLSQSKDSVQKFFEVDDVLHIVATAEIIKPPLNPHQFDYKKYMLGLGIQDQIQLTSNNYILGKNSTKSLFGYASKFRNTIITKLKQENFGEEELSVIQALLLGQRNDLSSETYDNYKNAGAVHILAISGLHIGILLLLLQFLLQPLVYLPYGKKIKLILTVLLLWSFALLAGLSASIIRSVTMFSFVAYAMHLNRPSNSFNILALSMFFILLVFDPNLLFQVGFQMSYAAVFAIVWIYPLLQKIWLPKNIITKKIWQLLSVSLAAQLGVLPISLFYFHQFPGLFFISNIIIVPVLGIILALGIFIITLSLLNLLPPLLVSLYNSLIGCMNTAINWVAKQEAFIFKNISFDSTQLVLAYTVIICLVLFYNKTNFKRAMILACSVLLFQLYTFHAAYISTQQQHLIIAHQTANTVMLQHNGNNLITLTLDDLKAERLTKDYAVAERIRSIENLPIKNAYEYKNSNIFLMDSLALYPPIKQPLDYLILSQSPKINLERFIDSIHPKNIIADGSNYRSYISRWQQTCLQRKIPFHYTGEKGAYYFTINSYQ